MRYPWRFVQRIGLMSSLLFVGVLGGLMTPLPSEAVPTVTLKVDSGTASSILITTSSTCTSAEVTLGYTACYAINTNLTVNGAGAAGGVQRSYNVRNAPGATARLRVGDKLGQDKFSLIGVQFIPAVANWGSLAANANETHVLTLTMSNPFNSAANVNNKGTYVYALRAGGEFRAGPTTAGACAGFTTTGVCNTTQNSVTFPGIGTFSPTLVSRNILSPTGANSQPLRFTVAGPTAPIVSFNGLTNTTLGQVNPTYPTFICDANGGTQVTGDKCTPSITQTMTVTLKGPDSFVLVNGGDAFGANCAAELSAQQQKQIAFLTSLVRFLQVLEQRRPNARLSAFVDKLEAFLATVTRNQDPDCPGARLVDLDIAVAAAADEIAFQADGAVPAEPVPAEPETGTITITKNTSTIVDNCGGELLPPCPTFNFQIDDGEGPLPTYTPQIVISGGTGTGTQSVTVAPGTYRVAESAQSGWTETSSNCGGGLTTSVVVPAGGTITCTFNNSRVVTDEATLTINVHLDAGCGGIEQSPCSPEIFPFNVTGPISRMVSVPIDQSGNGSVVMHNMIEGTYGVHSNAQFPLSLQSSNCQPTATGGVVVTSGGNASCNFTFEYGGT